MQEALAAPAELSRPKPVAGPAGIGPDGIIPGVKVAAPKKDPKAIWDDDEIPDILEDDIDDGRIQPDYDICYAQAVGTEDTYLGMSGKTNSSISCETMIVSIELPEAKSLSELELDVQEQYLRLRSNSYKLGLHLPHCVDSEKGKAKWVKDKGRLEVRLPVRRDQFGMALSM